MKILVPTDFSKNVLNAFELAIIIAQKTNSELTLLHACELPAEQYSLAYPLIAEQARSDVKTANEKLHKMCQQVSEAHKITTNHVVTTGNPRDEIVTSARNMSADLIIMGTKGASGIDKILFGSNTASVIKKASCPVLAVPENASHDLPKRIAFATNYHDSDMDTLKKLTRLSGLLGAKLMLLHVPKKKLKSEERLLAEFSKAVAKESGYPQPFQYALAHEDPQKGIELFVDSAEADWLSLSTEKRSFFRKIFDKSMAAKLVHQARMPLLVYQATSEEGALDLEF